MTMSEKAKFVVKLLDNDSNATEEVVMEYLQLAEQKILDRLYPFGHEDKQMPDRYCNLHCELAQRMFLRRGGEGEKSHEENGINRIYDSVDDEDILSRLTPFAVVM